MTTATKTAKRKAKTSKAAKSTKAKGKELSFRELATECDSFLGRNPFIRLIGLDAPISHTTLGNVSRIAQKLYALTSGNVSVTYNPGERYLDDPGSQGALMTAHMEFENEEDFATLDIRKGGLAIQMANHLRRIGQYHIDEARKLEKMAKNGELPEELVEPQHIWMMDDAEIKRLRARAEKNS